MQVATADSPGTESWGLLERLPLATLYLSERCNSRCVSCDYWRHGQADLTLAAVRQLLPDLVRLRTEVVQISGGEPLLNPEWAAIAQLLRAQDLRLWLLTSGLSLLKHARRAAALFEAITVSLDGTSAASYAAIRGLDAFDKVCAGIRAAAAAGAAVSVRVTLQRANFRELSAFVDLARRVDARRVSFLAVDVANFHAFARQGEALPDLALHADELAEFAQQLAALEREHAEDFRSGFIAETPQKLRRMQQYFAAVCGLGSYPPVRCNAPEFSAVISARGQVHPCFFISGPGGSAAGQGLERTLNDAAHVAQRRGIRAGSRPECARCVCSMWRDPSERSGAQLLARAHATAPGGRA